MTFKPVRPQRLHMRDRGVEHVGVFVLPLGREVAPRPSAAIDHVARVGRRFERAQPRERLPASRAFHSPSLI